MQKDNDRASFFLSRLENILSVNELILHNFKL